MDEIGEHGYEACSVKALSERSGITRTSFYNAFGSSEELFLEILEIYNGSKPDREWFPINETCYVLKAISQGIHNICKKSRENQNYPLTFFIITSLLLPCRGYDSDHLWTRRLATVGVRQGELYCERPSMESNKTKWLACIGYPPFFLDCMIFDFFQTVICGFLPVESSCDSY